jgi:hypothetical protein
MGGGSLMGGGFGLLMGGGSPLGGKQHTYQDVRNKAEAAVPATSALRSDQRAWGDMINLLVAVSDLKSEELKAAVAGLHVRTNQAVTESIAEAVGGTAEALLKTIRVDDALYSNISRRLRADMRIDRERFGRLRDGMR